MQKIERMAGRTFVVHPGAEVVCVHANQEEELQGAHRQLLTLHNAMISSRHSKLPTCTAIAQAATWMSACIVVQKGILS